MSRRNEPGPTAPVGLWILLSHAIATQAVMQLLRVTASYRAIELEMPLAWLGLLATVFHIAPALVSVQVGRLVDRRGETLSLVLGALCVLVASAGFFLAADSLPVLFVLIAVLGMGHSMSIIGEQSYLSRKTTDANRDAFFGYYTVAVSFGQLLSPLLISALTGDALLPPTSMLFLIGLAITVALLLLSLPLKGAPMPPAAVPQPPAKMMALLRMPGFTLAMVANVIVVVSIDMFLTYLPALGTQNGIAGAAIGTLLAIRAASSMSSRFFTSFLLRHIPRKSLLVASIGVAAVATCLVPMTDSVWVLGALMVFAGLGLGLCLPLTLVWTTRITPPGVLGSALSLRQTGNRLAQVAIPSVMAGVASVTGLAGIFWIAGGSLAAVACSIQGLVRTRI